jgi:hypothetical protein
LIKFFRATGIEPPLRRSNPGKKLKWLSKKSGARYFDKKPETLDGFGSRSMKQSFVLVKYV